MVLLSSHPIEKMLSASIRRGQVPGGLKDGLDSLPLGHHSAEFINGYLLLQFITVINFLRLKPKYTVW